MELVALTLLATMGAVAWSPRRRPGLGRELRRAPVAEAAHEEYSADLALWDLLLWDAELDEASA